MADRLEKRKVMLATGHSHAAVFDAYADHSNEEVFHEVERAATSAAASKDSGDSGTPAKT
jgi:hypothetical protein